MRMKSIALFVSLVVISFNAVAIPQLKQNMSLLRARDLLLKHGWQPIAMHQTDGYEYDGAEKEFVRRGFMEVDSCSNDSARCILFYRKAERCLRLDTIGEHMLAMKVVRWTDECPATVSKSPE